MSALSFLELSLKLLGGEQPNLTGGIFKGPRCAFWGNYFGPLLVQTQRPNFFMLTLEWLDFSLKILGREQPNITGVILRSPRCAFWGNCTLAHFCCSTVGQNHLRLHLRLLNQFQIQYTLGPQICF